jgi:hypothetical protein
MDHHTVAAISICGTCLDVLGGLYLAYDLLGGQHGPLRLLTRMVTYSVVFGVGYGLGLGLVFGVAAGIATGVTVAIELQRAGYKHDHYSMRWEVLFSAIRGAAFGAGVYQFAGLTFAATYCLLSTGGQVIAYSRGIRPGMDYIASRKPRLSRRQAWSAVVRCLGQIAATLLCSALVRNVDHAAWSFAIRLGLVTGIVTAVGTTVNPYIEYYADNLPQRRLGVFGIWLVFCGFLLQSVQYWVALLDIPVS